MKNADLNLQNEKQANKKAQYTLGTMYDNGQCVLKDKEKAFENTDKGVSKLALDYWNQYLAD